MPEEDGPAEETRAIARLPGLDIAILHVAARPGQGERVTVTLEATPLPALPGADPLALWMQMVQTAWTPWLALTSALWGLPRLPNR
jgi:hypothetical protein